MRKKIALILPVAATLAFFGSLLYLWTRVHPAIALLLAYCVSDVVLRKVAGLFQYLRDRKEILAETGEKNAHPFKNPRP